MADSLEDNVLPFRRCPECTKPFWEKNKTICLRCRKKFLRINTNEYARNRRTRALAIVEDFTWNEWERKKAMTKGICPKCQKHVGISLLTLDHIKPLSKAAKGEVYTIDDIQPLCQSCNSRKGALWNE